MNSDPQDNLKIHWEKTATRQDKVVMEVLLEFIEHALQTRDSNNG